MLFCSNQSREAVSELGAAWDEDTFVQVSISTAGFLKLSVVSAPECDSGTL